MTVQLYEHQRKFVEIARERPRYAWFADPGCGKTIGTFAAISEQGGKTLVLAPKSILHSAWARDARHFPNLRTAVVSGTPAKRRAQIAGEWDVAITNYESFKSHLRDFLDAGVDRLIVDESSKIKAPDSQITKAAIWFSDQVRSVYLLSGTPCPNNGTEIWPQLRCLTRAEAGQTYWSFVNHYYVPVKRRIYVKGKPKDVISGFSERRDRAPHLEALLRKWSWRLRKSDCLDLPEQNDIMIPVALEGDQLRHYLRIRDDARLEVGGGEVSQIKAAAILTKLRQCTGGFVLGGGDPVAVGDAKMEALSDLLDSLGPEEPVVIWAEYRAEIRAIVEMIEKRGERVEALYGDTSHDAAGIAARFQGGRTTRLVCHPASAGHGVTLTAACYAVYYSWSFSNEQATQSRDRIHRIGQTRPCTYYRLLCEGTVDEVSLRVLRRKGAAAEAMSDILAEALQQETTPA